jgi:Zn-dependent alcohol dehydrogenase
MRAAIVRAIGDPELDVVDDAELVDVTTGTLRVAIRATGVCHSDLEGMITRRAPIEDVNDVFDDMRTGTDLRTVLTF